MVVDDEIGVRSSLEAVLERAGWQVWTHDSGFGLIVTMRKFEPHVVMLDVEMPGLNGDAALRAIQTFERLPFAPPVVIFYSGQSEDELRTRTETSGAWGYLCKPATLQEIVDTAEAAFRHGHEGAPPRTRAQS